VSRALGALILGAALALVALVFDSASLYVPAVALLLASGGALIWVGLAAAGAGIEAEPGPPTIEEGRPYPLRVTVHTGLLPAPGGELETDLTQERIALGGMSARRLRIDVLFERRGRRWIEPPSFTIHDPLRLVTRTVRDRGPDAELLVLPRIEPVTAPDGSGGGGAGSLGDGQSAAAALRGAAAGSAAELDLDGLRPYRTGTPASRIHWPAVARSGEMLERRLTAESDSAPLVVLDASQPPSEEALDAAVRAAASLCVFIARRGGLALLLPGDRRPTTLPADLAGWPAQHARLALVGPASQRPPLARARRSGAVIWVSARPDPPRDLARTTAGAGWLVTPLTRAGDQPDFEVAGCGGRRVTRKAPAGSGVAA
jgi:uncharacterized protein (DUF58 family)